MSEFTKGIPSVPDVPASLTLSDIQRILDPLARIISIRQGRFDPLDRWVTQQDLIDAGLQTSETVQSPVVVETPTSNYPFTLAGDIAGGPTTMGTGNPTTMSTSIDLPNVVVIDGGDSASTFPGETTGPYGVFDFGVETRDEGTQVVAATSILDFVGTGVTVTNPSGNQARVSISSGSLTDGTVTNATLRWSGSAWVEEPDFKVNTNGGLDFGTQGFALRGDNVDGYLFIYSPSGEATVGQTWYSDAGNDARFRMEAGASGVSFSDPQNGDTILKYNKNAGIELYYNDTKRIETTSVGATVTGELTSTSTINAPAATTSIPSMNLPHGSAPSSPSDGDMWTTTAGLYVRINGSTVGPLS